MDENSIDKVILSYGYQKEERSPHPKCKSYTKSFLDGIKVSFNYIEEDSRCFADLKKGENSCWIYSSFDNKAVKDESELKKCLDEVDDALGKLSKTISALKNGQGEFIVNLQNTQSGGKIAFSFRFQVFSSIVSLRVYVLPNPYRFYQTVCNAFGQIDFPSENQNGNEVYERIRNYEQMQMSHLSEGSGRQLNVKIDFSMDVASELEKLISSVIKETENYMNTVEQRTNMLLAATSELERVLGIKAKLKRYEGGSFSMLLEEGKYSYELDYNGTRRTDVKGIATLEFYHEAYRCFPDIDISNSTEIEGIIKEFKAKMVLREEAKALPVKAFNEFCEKLKAFPEITEGYTQKSTKYDKTTYYGQLQANPLYVSFSVDFLLKPFNSRTAFDNPNWKSDLLASYVHVTFNWKKEMDEEMSRLPKPYLWQLYKLTDNVMKKYKDFKVEQTGDFVRDLKELSVKINEFIEL